MLNRLANWSLGADGNGATATLNVTPGLPGAKGVCLISGDPTWNGSIKLEGSDDGGTTWVDVVAALTTTQARQLRVNEIALKGAMRAVVASYSAGTVTVAILGSS